MKLCSLTFSKEITHEQAQRSIFMQIDKTKHEGTK